MVACKIFSPAVLPRASFTHPDRPETQTKDVPCAALTQQLLSAFFLLMFHSMVTCTCSTQELTMHIMAKRGIVQR